MTRLSDRHLAKMRAEVNLLLPGTAIIQSNGGSVNSKGVYVDSWAAVSSGTVACRLDPLSTSQSSDVALLQGQERQTTYWQLTVPYNAPLNADNRVVIGSTTYSVVSLYDVPSWNVSTRAIVAEVE